MPDNKVAQQNKKDFPPGSTLAQAQGCTCCPKENNHGKGYNNDIHTWLVDNECPLHHLESPLFNKKLRKKKEMDEEEE